MARVSAELHPVTRSRPLYLLAAPDPAARLHLIVTDGQPLPAELQTRFAGCATELWVGGADALPDLAARLAVETTGLRLHIVGSEAFLWDVARLAEAAGLCEQEITMQPAGPPHRRVQCVHCKSFLEAVGESMVDCPGCGLRLLVRDHFSRRLAAFQGIARHGVTRGEGG